MKCYKLQRPDLTFQHHIINDVIFKATITDNNKRVIRNRIIVNLYTNYSLGFNNICNYSSFFNSFMLNSTNSLNLFTKLHYIQYHTGRSYKSHCSIRRWPYTFVTLLMFLV
ncbi:hypothetical protein C0J52_16834 [Blattella germanica]|nr:hypothetical protein C0J52_16834 [Blattella germanica]